MKVNGEAKFYRVSFKANRFSKLWSIRLMSPQRMSLSRDIFLSLENLNESQWDKFECFTYLIRSISRSQNVHIYQWKPVLLGAKHVHFHFCVFHSSSCSANNMKRVVVQMCGRQVFNQFSSIFSKRLYQFHTRIIYILFISQTTWKKRGMIKKNESGVIFFRWRSRHPLWKSALLKVPLWSNFYLLSFRCITKNSMKEWKRRLRFANTCISSGDI